MRKLFTHSVATFITRAIAGVVLAGLATVAWSFATPPELQGDPRCLAVYALVAGSLAWCGFTMPVRKPPSMVKAEAEAARKREEMMRDLACLEFDHSDEEVDILRTKWLSLDR